MNSFLFVVLQIKTLSLFTLRLTAGFVVEKRRGRKKQNVSLDRGNEGVGGGNAKSNGSVRVLKKTRWKSSAQLVLNFLFIFFFHEYCLYVILYYI